VTGLPLLVDLTGRRVLVVGAGRVATRRVPALLEAGAIVDVVARQVSTPFSDVAVGLAQRTGIEPANLRIHQRPFETSDLFGAWLVLACTDDAAVNAHDRCRCSRCPTSSASAPMTLLAALHGHRRLPGATASPSPSTVAMIRCARSRFETRSRSRSTPARYLSVVIVVRPSGRWPSSEVVPAIPS